MSGREESSHHSTTSGATDQLCKEPLLRSRSGQELSVDRLRRRLIVHGNGDCCLEGIAWVEIQSGID